MYNITIKQIDPSMFKKRPKRVASEENKSKSKARKASNSRIVRGVNSADLKIYLSNKYGNPNKEKNDKCVVYNNLKDNTKVTSFNFHNEVIKLPEPTIVKKEKKEEAGKTDKNEQAAEENEGVEGTPKPAARKGEDVIHSPRDLMNKIYISV
jgi:hypothetical protein